MRGRRRAEREVRPGQRPVMRGCLRNADNRLSIPRRKKKDEKTVEQEDQRIPIEHEEWRTRISPARGFDGFQVPFMAPPRYLQKLIKFRDTRTRVEVRHHRYTINFRCITRRESESN